eukprot:jgi/Ulvmu1/10549/UM065_0002.1
MSITRSPRASGLRFVHLDHGSRKHREHPPLRSLRPCRSTERRQGLGRRLSQRIQQEPARQRTTGKTFKISSLVRDAAVAKQVDDMFFFCRWVGMLPLRFIPLAPWAISAYVARFAAAADIKQTAQDMRTGMAFTRITHGQLHQGRHANRLAISLAGGWSANSQTYKEDYLHVGYFNAMMRNLIRSLGRHV